MMAEKIFGVDDCMQAKYIDIFVDDAVLLLNADLSCNPKPYASCV